MAVIPADQMSTLLVYVPFSIATIISGAILQRCASRQQSTSARSDVPLFCFYVIRYSYNAEVPHA
jgi:hypothetical protein